MKNTVFPHKFWRPFLDSMPQLFFRPQYVWFPVHLKGHLIPLCYETLVVNWQNWLFTLFHQSRSVLSPNPITPHRKLWDAYYLSMPDAEATAQMWTTIRSITHWGLVTHICVSKLTITGSDNGLSPGRRQAIIWTNAGILLIGPLGTNFSEIFIEMYISLFKKMYLKMSSGQWRPFCPGLNVINHWWGRVNIYDSNLGHHWSR